MIDAACSLKMLSLSVTQLSQVVNDFWSFLEFRERPQLLKNISPIQPILLSG